MVTCAECGREVIKKVKRKNIEKIKLARYIDAHPAEEPYSSDYATGVGLLKVMGKLNEIIEKIND